MCSTPIFLTLVICRSAALVTEADHRCDKFLFSKSPGSFHHAVGSDLVGIMAEHERLVMLPLSHVDDLVHGRVDIVLFGMQCCTSSAAHL